MRVYFGSCCFQRPLDDQTQPRIKIESEAVLVMLNAVQSGDIILLNSGLDCKVVSVLNLIPEAIK